MGMCALGEGSEGEADWVKISFYCSVMVRCSGSCPQAIKAGAADREQIETSSISARATCRE